ncbi:unnamed protein product [Ixodes hexagonus]
MFTLAAGQIIVARGCQRKSCPRECWRRGGAPRPGAAAKVVRYSSSTQRQISEGEEFQLLSWRDQLRDRREQPTQQQKHEPLQPNPASDNTLSPTARPFSAAINLSLFMSLTPPRKARHRAPLHKAKLLTRVKITKSKRKCNETLKFLPNL